MMHWLPYLLHFAGLGMILLAVAHIPISRELQWREEAARMSPASASIFHVHTLFICVTLVLMGLPAFLVPHVFLQETQLGAWVCWSYAAFWGLRLIVQWFVFPSSLWRGKRRETVIHYLFTLIWLALTLLFATCGLLQSMASTHFFRITRVQP